MLRRRTQEEFEAHCEGGVRHLFTLGQYGFQDTLDAEERYHHYILEGSGSGGEQTVYEVDRDTMYEFMARFLAGTYEMEEYRLEQSPAHNTLLDVLELSAARARSGESEFSWEEFDQADSEVMDDGEEPKE